MPDSFKSAAFIVLTLFVVQAPAFGQAPYADGQYVPPVSSSLYRAQIHAIPQAELSTMIRESRRTHRFTVFEGMNEALARDAAQAKIEKIGAGFPTNLPSHELFDFPQEDGAYLVFSCDITSEDAYALRLQVDLLELNDGEEVYVVDPLGPRAFGPYTAEDHVEGGTWLPVTEGDTATLIVRTLGEGLPVVRVNLVSHFFKGIDEPEELPCNNDVTCIADPALNQVFPAVGIMVIPGNSGDQALCSGSLIENPDTPESEPYYITAWHCTPDFGSPTGVDIIWDFRSATCNGDNPPLLSSLPRSNSIGLLATDNVLDGTLLELDTVPIGEFGRTYLGWDTRTPIIGEDMVGVHHPAGAHMRISFGVVESLTEPSLASGFEDQIKVFWDDGVTEGGSSGSCLLFDDGTLRLFGMLSNGFVHQCVDISNNFDWYTSFRHFFPQIEEFLVGGAGEGEGEPEGMAEGEGEPEGAPEGEGEGEGEGVAEGEGEGESESFALILDTIPAGVGSVSADPPDGPYAPGTEVTLHATAADGWRFERWTGQLSGFQNPTTVVMDRDRSVSAFFLEAIEEGAPEGAPEGEGEPEDEGEPEGMMEGEGEMEGENEIPPSTVEVSVSSVDFGEVEVNVDKDAMIAVTNTGDVDAVVRARTAPPFQVVSAKRTTLAPGETLDVMVRFVPTRPGVHTGFLVIDGNGFNITVPLVAEAVSGNGAHVVVGCAAQSVGDGRYALDSIVLFLGAGLLFFRRAHRAESE